MLSFFLFSYSVMCSIPDFWLCRTGAVGLGSGECVCFIWYLVYTSLCPPWCSHGSVLYGWFWSHFLFMVVQFINTQFEAVLLIPEPAKRVSRYYVILGAGYSRLWEWARPCWVIVAPELSDALWKEVLDMYLTIVIACTDRMIQLRYSSVLYPCTLCLHA